MLKIIKRFKLDNLKGKIVNISVLICFTTEKKLPNYWNFKVNANIKLLATTDGNVLKEHRIKRKIRCWCKKLGILKTEEPWNNFLQAAKENDNRAFFECEIEVDPAKSIWNLNDKPELQNAIAASTSNCPICMNSFSTRLVSATKCFHLLCTCIERSIQQQKKCSLCNAVAAVEDLRTIFMAL